MRCAKCGEWLPNSNFWNIVTITDEYGGKLREAVVCHNCARDLAAELKERD